MVFKRHAHFNFSVQVNVDASPKIINSWIVKNCKGDWSWDFDNSKSNQILYYFFEIESDAILFKLSLNSDKIL